RADGDTAVAGDQVVVDILHLGGDRRPAVGLGYLPGLLAQTAAERFIRQQEVETFGERLRAAPGDQIAGAAVLHRLLEPAHARGDYRYAAGHRLQRHHPEALVIRG